jgi:D-arabinose 1-dehydrogenase-like Zn-dependent alcohol dehydrogenase
MSVDYPRAWELVLNTLPETHHPECSFRVTGCILCDCDVLLKHPEYLDDSLHTIGGHTFSGVIVDLE